MTRSGSRTVVAWLVLAIVGLVMAVGVAYAASRLASPKVGLSSEPLTAGARLGPRTRGATRPQPSHRRKGRKHNGSTQATPAPTTPSAPPVTPPPPAPTPPAPTPPAATPAAPTPPARTTTPAPNGDPVRHGGDDNGGRRHGADD